MSSSSRVQILWREILSMEYHRRKIEGTQCRWRWKSIKKHYHRWHTAWLTARQKCHSFRSPHSLPQHRRIQPNVCASNATHSLRNSLYFFLSNGNDQTKIKRTICVVNCVSAANSSLSTICLHMFECVFASVHSRFASLIFHSAFGLILMCRIDVMLAYSNIIYLCVYSRLERNSVTECVHGSATNYVYIFHSRSLVTVPPTRQKRHKHTQAFAIRHIRQIAMNMLWKKNLKINLLFRYSAYFPTGLAHTHTITQQQSNWLHKSTSCRTLTLAHLCRYNLYHSRFSLSCFFFLLLLFHRRRRRRWRLFYLFISMNRIVVAEQ